MKLTFVLTGLASLLPAVLAVGEYGQCGGINYTGSTTCDAGLVCVRINDYYYQCQKGSTTSTTTKASTTTTKASTTTTTKASTTTTTTTSTTAVSTGTCTGATKFKYFG
ncbi:hypothetical protein FRC20_008326, partial [Serendipita sp. 405]